MSESGTLPPAGDRYAGFWVRFAAAFLDGLLLAVIGWMLPRDNMVLQHGAQAAYAICFVALKGATPGKMALGPKIISVDGEPVGWGRSIVRYVGSIVSGLLLFIGYLMIPFDERKRSLHDRIAGTYVVRE